MRSLFLLISAVIRFSSVGFVSAEYHHGAISEDAAATSTLLTKYGRSCHRKSKSIVASHNGYDGPDGSYHGKSSSVNVDGYYGGRTSSSAWDNGYHGPSTIVATPVSSASWKDYANIPAVPETSSSALSPSPSKFYGSVESSKPYSNDAVPATKSETRSSPIRSDAKSSYSDHLLTSSASPSSEISVSHEPHVTSSLVSVPSSSSSVVDASATHVSSSTSIETSSSHVSSSSFVESTLSQVSSISAPDASSSSLPSSASITSSKTSTSSHSDLTSSSSEHITSSATSSTASSASSSASPSSSACVNAVRDGSFEDMPLNVFGPQTDVWTTDRVTTYENGLVYSTPYGNQLLSFLGSRTVLPFIRQTLDIADAGNGYTLGYAFNQVEEGSFMFCTFSANINDVVVDSFAVGRDSGLHNAGWQRRSITLPPGLTTGDVFEMKITCSSSSATSVPLLQLLVDDVTLSSAANHCPGSGSGTPPSSSTSMVSSVTSASSATISSMITSSSASESSSSSVSSMISSSSISSAPAASVTCEVVRDNSFEAFPVDVPNADNDDWITNGALTAGRANGGGGIGTTPYGTNFLTMRMTENVLLEQSVLQVINIADNVNAYTLNYSFAKRLFYGALDCTVHATISGSIIDSVNYGFRSGLNQEEWTSRSGVLPVKLDQELILMFQTSCLRTVSTASLEFWLDNVSVSTVVAGTTCPAGTRLIGGLPPVEPPISASPSASQSPTSSIASSASSAEPPPPTNTCNLMRDPSIEEESGRRPAGYWQFNGATLVSRDDATGHTPPNDSNFFVSFEPYASQPEDIPTLSQTLQFTPQGESAWTNTVLTFQYARGVGTDDNMQCILNVSVDGVGEASIGVDGEVGWGIWREQSITFPGLVGQGSTIALSVVCNAPTEGEYYEVWVDDVNLQAFTTGNCPAQQK